MLSNLPTMPAKNQAILLWTYTRDVRHLEHEGCLNFLDHLLDSMSSFQNKYDNFDLLLIVQAVQYL
jgi:hypothetical protein